MGSLAFDSHSLADVQLFMELMHGDGGGQEAQKGASSADCSTTCQETASSAGPRAAPPAAPASWPSCPLLVQLLRVAALCAAPFKQLEAGLSPSITPIMQVRPGVENVGCGPHPVLQ